MPKLSLPNAKRILALLYPDDRLSLRVTPSQVYAVYLNDEAEAKHFGPNWTAVCRQAVRDVFLPEAKQLPDDYNPQ